MEMISDILQFPCQLVGLGAGAKTLVHMGNNCHLMDAFLPGQTDDQQLMATPLPTLGISSGWLGLKINPRMARGSQGGGRVV